MDKLPTDSIAEWPLPKGARDAKRQGVQAWLVRPVGYSKKYIEQRANRAKSLFEARAKPEKQTILNSRGTDENPTANNRRTIEIEHRANAEKITLEARMKRGQIEFLDTLMCNNLLTFVDLLHARA